MPTAIEVEGITADVLRGSLLLKQASAEIDVVVHSIGILRSLPLILDDEEAIESLSLGAGNTGRPFDLETNKRIAEFKFIDWKGHDAVRQDALFKDFYELAEYQTEKKKYLYVVGLDLPQKFLRGKRSCESVLKRHGKTWDHFTSVYGKQHPTVGSYFAYRQNSVNLVDLGELLDDLRL